MNLLQRLTGGGNAMSSHSRGAAYSHRSTKESTGRRVHADVDHAPPPAHLDENRTAVGTVLVMHQDRSQYSTNKDGKIVPRDNFFQALLAPDCDTALTFLSTQPPGAYLLVKEPSDDIAVYVKFRQAVRSFIVIKSKDLRKNKSTEEPIKWGNSYRLLRHSESYSDALNAQSTMMTPIHRLFVPSDMYHYLERCWLRFLPPVQAIIFELCSQSYYMDEDMAMEDWSASIIMARVPCMAFISEEACSFHLFNTSFIAEGELASPSHAAAAHSVGIPVRFVEFDVVRLAVLISDGTFRPTAFVTPVHFASNKAYDPEIGFAMIRDNFLFPDRVTLKESTQNSSSSGGSASMWHDAGVTSGHPTDTESQLMAEMQALIARTIPDEPLPDDFLTTYLRLHALWEKETARGQWSSQDKLRCVNQLLPYYVEWFLAVASTHGAAASELRHQAKPDIFPQLAAALHGDIVYIAHRGDDATIARLVHHLLLALSLRADVPAPLVTLIGTLYSQLPHFRVIFMRNHGASLLWKSIHAIVNASMLANANASILATVATPLLERAAQEQQQKLRGVAPMMADTTKRRSSLFGMAARKQNSRNGSSRKSLFFNASLVLPVTTVASVQVFFRLNPLQLQLQLLTQLHDSQFSPSTTPNLATLSPLYEMTQFIERIAFFLMTDPASPTWDKDVTQVLRMKDLYIHLHRRLLSSVSEGDTTGEEAVMECIATLYRLETKYRRHASVSDVGEKKYWYLFHLLRHPIRVFHERLRDQLNELDNNSEASSHADGGESSDVVGSAPDTQAATRTGFDLLAHILPKLPMTFVTEFVLVSLDDLLQMTQNLYALIERFPSPSSVPSLVGYARVLICIFTVILRRTGDVDLQLLLTRVLACSGSSVPVLVQLLLSESLRISKGAHAIEREIISFAEAFATLATSLAQSERWHTVHSSLYSTLENKNDVETNEQRKTLLMATVLSPEKGVADSDDVLWDILLDIFLPAHYTPSDTGQRDGNLLRVVRRYHSQAFSIEKDQPMTYSPVVKDERRRNRAAYLQLRAKLFLSPIMDTVRMTTAQLRALVETHWDYIYQLRSKFAADQMDASECQARVLLHLQCLIALASERSEFPVLEETFLDFRVARELFKGVNISKMKVVEADDANEEETQSPVPLSLDLTKLGDPQNGVFSISASSELLVSTTDLHATTLLLVLSCIVREPHKLNDELVPRYFVPEERGDRYEDEDLLHMLQHHLRVNRGAELLAALFGRLQGWELAGTLGLPARAHALRRLLKLLVPDSYDPSIYESAEDTVQTVGDDGEPPSPAARREYIAKGAFATVYKTVPSFDISSALAIKVCSFQKVSGNLCVVAEVFSEVGVLERLRGVSAATKLIDYGNNTKDTMGFEVVMEHCPATLAEWRGSLNGSGEGSGPSFRSLLSLVLSVFGMTATAVAKIHQNQVCHFDIKADNVLVRDDAASFTAGLLKLLRSSKDSENAFCHVEALERKICVGDFGEAVVMPMPMPMPNDGIRLSRTRGTEAIKSPEMLSVKGSTSEDAVGADGVLVGPASDVWSLGCLLYELLTEELMFGRDDWAQLYAHLVAPSAAETPVIRDDHREKLQRVLRPQSATEHALAEGFIQFLGSILQRTPSSRPSLSTLIEETEAQLRMVQALSLQPADKEFELVAKARLETEAGRSTPRSRSLPLPPSRVLKCSGTQAPPRFGRLFWNFYLTRRVEASSSNESTPKEHPLSGIRLLRELGAVQLLHEASFSHFIYFTFDDTKHSVFSTTCESSMASDDANVPFVEIVEGVGRTTFYFNRARVLACLNGSETPRAANGPTLVRLLLQHSRGILPVLQRHLCHQDKRVLIVPADYTSMRGLPSRQASGTSESILDLMTTTLMFFLIASCRVPPLEIIAAFVAECSAIMDLPNAHLLQQLVTLHDQLTMSRSRVATTEQSINARVVVQCRCGDKVFAVPTATLVTRSEDLPGSSDAVPLDMNGEVVWDWGQAAVVYGHGHENCRCWRVVDTLEVDRLESQLRAVLLLHLGTSASSMATTSSASHPERARRRSQNLLAARSGHHQSKQQGTAAATRHPSHDSHQATLREHVPFLLHGLYESAIVIKAGAKRTLSSESLRTAMESWTMYECRLCNTPVCVMSSSTTRIALPVDI